MGPSHGGAASCWSRWCTHPPQQGCVSRSQDLRCLGFHWTRLTCLLLGRRYQVSQDLSAKSRGTSGVVTTLLVHSTKDKEEIEAALSSLSEPGYGQQITTQDPSQQAGQKTPSKHWTSFKLPKTILTPSSRFFFDQSEERGNCSLQPWIWNPCSHFQSPSSLTAAPSHTD